MTRKLAVMALLVLLALPQTGCVVIGTIFVVKQIKASNRKRAAVLGTEVEKTVTPAEVIKEPEVVRPIEATETRSKHEPESQNPGKITRVYNAF